jgi:hypothetical protein
LFLDKISSFEKNSSIVFLPFPSDIHPGNGHLILSFFEWI